MVRSDFGPRELEASRAALLQLYFKRPALREVPLVIVQRCQNEEDAPKCSWVSLKKMLQVQLLRDQGIACALFRLVVEENTFVKSLGYIFDWILKKTHGL